MKYLLILFASLSAVLVGAAPQNFKYYFFQRQEVAPYEPATQPQGARLELPVNQEFQPQAAFTQEQVNQRYVLVPSDQQKQKVQAPAKTYLPQVQVELEDGQDIVDPIAQRYVLVPAVTESEKVQQKQDVKTPEKTYVPQVQVELEDDQDEAAPVVQTYVLVPQQQVEQTQQQQVSQDNQDEATPVVQKYVLVPEHYAVNQNFPAQQVVQPQFQYFQQYNLPQVPQAAVPPFAASVHQYYAQFRKEDLVNNSTVLKRVDGDEENKEEDVPEEVTEDAVNKDGVPEKYVAVQQPRTPGRQVYARIGSNGVEIQTGYSNQQRYNTEKQEENTTTESAETTTESAETTTELTETATLPAAELAKSEKQVALEPDSESVNDSNGDNNGVSSQEGSYYVLLPNGQLQKVVFMTEADLHKMEVTARLQYQNIDPIRGPIYTYNMKNQPLIQLFK